MAQLDRFLAVMTEKNASQLTLRAGSSPRLTIGGREIPVSTAEPSAPQILKLLREILNEGEAERLESSGRLETTVSREGLPPAALRATLDGDELIATFSAVVADGGGNIDELFRLMIERGASDLHVSSDEKPQLRVDGHMERIEHWPRLAAEDVRRLIEPIAPEKYRREFDEDHDTDFAYELEGVARFRCNFFMDRKGPGGVFRVIPSEIMTVEDLNLSSDVLDLCRLTKGLVLVTGPTGSGKSTTLCALIDYINRIRNDHIITIEDPIEFTHENKSCLINQREVGNHTGSFKRALRAALREDPDIVLIGEMRDLETIAIAIETAETGHLVFGTLHTTTAISTVDRIIDQFPPSQQAQIRVMLAESLKGVISQTLCKKKGGGRVAALEVLMGIPAVVKLIREGKTFQIPSIMQTGKKYGMVTLNDALMQLVRAGTVEPEEAYLRAVDKLGIVKSLQTVAKDLSFIDSQKEEALV